MRLVALLSLFLAAACDLPKGPDGGVADSGGTGGVGGGMGGGGMGGGGMGGGGAGGGGAGGGGTATVSDGGYCDACARADGFCINGGFLDYFVQGCKCAAGAVTCGYYPRPPGPCAGGEYCNAGLLTCAATPDAGCARECSCANLLSSGTGRWSCRDTCGPAGSCPTTPPTGACADPAVACRYSVPMQTPPYTLKQTDCTCGADGGTAWACF